MKRKLSLSALFLLGALPLTALAAEPLPPSAADSTAAPAAKEEPAPLFQQLDTNRDGYVTREEATRSADVTARFNELDANHDGRISAAEFKQGMQAHL